MHVELVKSRPLWLLLAGIALLAVTAAPAQGQFRLFHGTHPDYCPSPPCPAPKVQEPPVAPPQLAPTEPKAPTTTIPPAPPTVAEPSISPEAAAATGIGTVALALPGMKGDQVPITAIAFGLPQNPTGQPRSSVIAAPLRSYKMSDDQSPQPRDRVLFDFNYYNNVGADVSRRLGIDLRDVAIYRETFGFEKSFLDNTASIGLRLPLNSLSASSDTPGQGGSDTDIGDLTTILKYAFWQNAETGTLVSTGLAITVPTGPSHFAGSSIPITHVTVLQPFVGYLWTADHWFVHGFTGIDVPTSSKDVTSIYNSFGFGYVISRAGAEERFLRSIAPTFEVHVTDPLNHRGAFRVSDPLGSADVVDLTAATTFGLGERSSLSIGVVTPVTGPKPFDIEALVQFNWSFGAGGRRAYAWASNLFGQ